MWTLISSVRFRPYIKADTQWPIYAPLTQILVKLHSCFYYFSKIAVISNLPHSEDYCLERKREIKGMCTLNLKGQWFNHDVVLVIKIKVVCALCNMHGSLCSQGQQGGRERGSVSNFEIRESEPKISLTRVGGWVRVRTREATLVNLGHVGEIYFKQVVENHTYNISSQRVTS